MKITRDEAARVAALAHIRFDEAGLERMAAEMTGILEYVDQLRAVDVAGVEDGGAAPMILRDDLPAPSLEREAVAANAPAWRDGFFIVPRVVGGD